MIKVGCCGFCKGKEEYFSHFPLVEIQQTFYQPPKLETARRWREEAPPHFEFSLKAWQLITHPPDSPTYRKAGLVVPAEKRERYGFFRPTPEVEEAWAATQEIAEALGARAMVFQCPPRFQESPENKANLRAFFRSRPRGDFLYAWEPRGGWSEGKVRELCRDLGLIHGVDPFISPPLWGEVRYFRLHGGPGYRHRYSTEELLRLRGMAQGNAYILFNNLSMFEDALRFQKLLRGE